MRSILSLTYNKPAWWLYFLRAGKTGLVDEANAPTDPWSTGGGIGSVGASPRGQGHIMLLLI